MSMECDCVEYCQRWVVYKDGSGGWFCPYVPDFLSPEADLRTTCKHTIHHNMKPRLMDSKNENDI